MRSLRLLSVPFRRRLLPAVLAALLAVLAEYPESEARAGALSEAVSTRSRGISSPVASWTFNSA